MCLIVSKMTAKGGVESQGQGVEKCITATLDEAMMMTGFGPYNILHMLLNGVILMGVIMQSLAMGYVLPAAQCDLHLTTQQQGLLAAIPFLAIILMSYLWGYLGDTRGRRPVMLYSMLLSILFTVIASFMPDAVSFGILLFISSVFVSGSTAVVYTYLGEFNNLQHRDKMVAFGSSFVGIGTVVLPGVSWLILPLDFSPHIPLLDIHYRPWRLLVVACALPYVFGSLFLYFSPESPKFLNAVGQQEQCLRVLRQIYAVNKLRLADDFPVKCLLPDSNAVPSEDSKKMSLWRSMKEQTVPLFKSPLLPWTCLTCFVQFGIFATTNGFYVWFPTILNSLANHEGGDTKICNVLEGGRQQIANNRTNIILCDDTINVQTFERSIYIGLLFSSMYIVVGFLVDFLGKKLILVVVLVVTGACGVGAHLANSQQIAVILFAIFQMSGACIGLMNAVVVELFPTKFRAMSVCLAMMMGRIGSMLGSNLIGFLLNTHCAVGFYLFGLIIVMNGLVCISLPGKKSTTKTKMADAPKDWQTHEPE